MSVRLPRGAEHPVEAIKELSRVVLRRAIDTDEPPRPMPAGASGTVVSVLGSGAAYLVEFTEPFAALVEVGADDVGAIPGERREDLSARRLVHRPS